MKYQPGGTHLVTWWSPSKLSSWQWMSRKMPKMFICCQKMTSATECHQSTDPNQDHYYCPLYHVCDLKCINWQTSLLDKKWSRKNCFVCAVSANINYKVDSSILVTFQSCEILISLDNFFFWPLMLLHLILLFSWTLLSSIFWFFFERCFSFCVILICSFP